MFSKLQAEIDALKRKLYKFMEDDENINAEVVLQYSQELDKLITEFYKLVQEKEGYHLNGENL